MLKMLKVIKTLASTPLRQVIQLALELAGCILKFNSFNDAVTVIDYAICDTANSR